MINVMEKTSNQLKADGAPVYQNAESYSRVLPEWGVERLNTPLPAGWNPRIARSGEQKDLREQTEDLIDLLRQIKEMETVEDFKSFFYLGIRDGIELRFILDYLELPEAFLLLLLSIPEGVGNSALIAMRYCLPQAVSQKILDDADDEDLNGSITFWGLAGNPSLSEDVRVYAGLKSPKDRMQYSIITYDWIQRDREETWNVLSDPNATERTIARWLNMVRE